jgi:hypothetical protein
VSRSSIVLAAALVALAAVIPASAVCCMGRPAPGVSAMHASMPCCADRCKMQRATRSTETIAVISARVQPITLTVDLNPSIGHAARSLSTPHQHILLHSSGPPAFVALRI